MIEVQLNNLKQYDKITLQENLNLKLLKQKEKLEMLKNRSKTIKNSILKFIEKKKMLSLISNESTIYKKDGINILYEENDSLNSTYKISNELIVQAKHSNDEMNNQEKNLQSTNEKLEIILGKVPVLGKLISSVGYHKVKEQVILGLVTGTCTYLLLLATFG